MTLGRTMALAVVAAALAHTAQAQQDFSKVQVKAALVAGNVYMLTGAGGEYCRRSRH